MLKKFPSDRINDTKNALFFLLQAPTYDSVTFNLQLLYELKPFKIKIIEKPQAFLLPNL